MYIPLVAVIIPFIIMIIFAVNGFIHFIPLSNLPDYGNIIIVAVSGIIGILLLYRYLFKEDSNLQKAK